MKFAVFVSGHGSNLQAIIDAVKRFKGASIIVTHDEMFLDQVATKLIIFSDEGIEYFPGTYQEFLERIGWDESDTKKTRVQKTGLKKKKDKHARVAFIKKRSSILIPLEKKVSAIERSIMKKEEKVKEINRFLITLSEEGDSERFIEPSKELHQLQQDIENLYDQLGSVSEELEKCSLELSTNSNR